MNEFERGIFREAGSTMSRQRFLRRTAMGAGGLWLGSRPGVLGQEPPATATEYEGPNIVLVRFGGGVRRRETIDPNHTYSPYLLKELAPKGTLYRNMMIEQFKGGATSHGQGTLYMLTGVYEKFQNAGKFLEEKFETSNPTIFEYLRRQYRLSDHQTLIVNGEDRTQEEFYSFSNHHLFGAQFKSETLSLFRFKLHVLRQKLGSGELHGEERKKAEKKVREMENHDHRTRNARQTPKIEAFWDRWQAYYGRSGFVNPRGDRLLTELTLWAMKHLQPRLVMVNYNDPDYVHWGNISHYTRGISTIDDGLKQLVMAVEADPFYRDNTVFVIVPDCGRDNNPLLEVPCQHHFNSPCAHEIWALLMGPGIQRGAVIDRRVDQIDIASTIGQLTGASATFSKGSVLEEAIV